MKYAPIDPILAAWATRHALHFYTTYRDEEVRSIDFVGPTGGKCQLWIDAPDQRGNVQVHVWDYKKRRKDFTGSANDLSKSLEEAYVLAMNWNGTPVRSTES